MRVLPLLLGVLFIVAGCGNNPTNQEPTRIDPKGGPSVEESSEKIAADASEVKAKLDLEEYPGVKVVEDMKLVSKSIAPDETRFILTRTSEDAPAKVVAFYEDKLKAKAMAKDGGQEIYGQSGRGNFVRVNIESEGTGSKITLRPICFDKK